MRTACLEMGRNRFVPILSFDYNFFLATAAGESRFFLTDRNVSIQTLGLLSYLIKTNT